MQKLIASNTDFLNNQEDASKDEQDKQTSKKNDKAGEEKINDQQEKKASKGINNKRVEDDKIVYENLNDSNLLLKNYLKDYDEKH